jgi:hypothetical protein
LHKIKVFYNEIGGANKTIQQALILVWLIELKLRKTEKPPKKDCVPKNDHFPEWCLKTIYHRK